RQPCVALCLAAAERNRAGHVVERRHRPAGAVFLGIFASLALVEVVLLGRKGERPCQGFRAWLLEREVNGRPAVMLETAERLAVVHELLVGHLAPAEVPPPARTRFALVVLEQPGRQQ